MTKKRTLDPEMIDSVAQNMFYALPLIKKRLLHMDIVQKEHGTPLSHVQVLAMLQDVGMMSVSEISRRLGIAKPNITPLVDRLFEAGYVDRQHGEARFHPRDHLPPDSDAGGGSFPLRVPRAARFAGKRRSHPLLAVSQHVRPPSGGLFLSLLLFYNEPLRAFLTDFSNFLFLSAKSGSFFAPALLFYLFTSSHVRKPGNIERSAASLCPMISPVCASTSICV